MFTVIIGLGSNLGRRKETLRRAIFLLQNKLRIQRISRFVSCRPAEGVTGGKFLNGVLQAKTKLQPDQLLKFLQSIEVSLGRPKNHKPFLPRTIDLDILFYENLVMNKKNLQIPHPAAWRRNFVVNPLLEIVPHWKDPVSGKKIEEIAGENNYSRRRNKNEGS